MQRPLVIAIFIGCLILIDGIVNDYKFSNIVFGAIATSVNDFFWFVGRLVGLTR